MHMQGKQNILAEHLVNQEQQTLGSHTTLQTLDMLRNEKTLFYWLSEYKLYRTLVVSNLAELGMSCAAFKFHLF